MSLAGWITTAIGTVGIGGIILLAIFAPAVLPIMAKVIVSIAHQIISTRIGVGAVCLVVGLLGGDQYGERRIRTEWAEARIAAAAEKIHLDNEAAARAATTDTKNTAAETTSDQSITEARDAYIKRLEAGVCVLDADSLDRLQNIK